MCGIVGVLTKKNEKVVRELGSIVKAMADTLVHRGPDFGAVWVDLQAHIGLGHRRLSILDLSPEGNQPMVSACGRYVMVFNGEIYNFRDIRSKIQKDFGFTKWRGHSDTEVMLAAISYWGVEESLKMFNGMFAFGVWDRQEKNLYLARDRFGEKPLYYGQVDDSFIFSSELKAFKKFPRWKGEINRDAIILFLRYGYIPSPLSIYQNIFKLLPGTFLKLPWDISAPLLSDKPQNFEYWSIKTAAHNGLKHPVNLSEPEILDELERLFIDSIKIRMESDVPLGAFLSGGIDSSIVVAFMQKLSTKPIKTFSIGFHEKEFNEALHAKEVAKYLGTEHYEEYLSPEQTLKIIPQIPSIYDEPFADPSQIPTFLVSQFARQSVTVCLSGDAGDEFFGGYNLYRIAKKMDGLLKWFPEMGKNISAKMVKKIPAHVFDKILSPMEFLLPDEFGGRYFGDKLHKLAEIIDSSHSNNFYQSLISHWRDTKDIVLGGKEIEIDRLQGLFSFNGNNSAAGMMLTDMLLYLPDDILVKVDRASMAVSLESRIPFLDPRIAEFAWKIPEKLKISKNKGKMILRKLLYRHVPRELVERPKMGFAVPVGQWLRGPLKSWAESLLYPERLKREGFFNVEKITTAWKLHQVGRRNLQHQLWNVLMFQAWLEKNENQ